MGLARILVLTGGLSFVVSVIALFVMEFQDLRMDSVIGRVHLVATAAFALHIFVGIMAVLLYVTSVQE